MFINIDKHFAGKEPVRVKICLTNWWIILSEWTNLFPNQLFSTNQKAYASDNKEQGGRCNKNRPLGPNPLRWYTIICPWHTEWKARSSCNYFIFTITTLFYHTWTNTINWSRLLSICMLSWCCFYLHEQQNNYIVLF